VKPKRCQFGLRAHSYWESLEACPLDHCACGTHDAANAEHECEEPSPDLDEIGEAERAAGWVKDP
jgi:hypothetical protein